VIRHFLQKLVPFRVERWTESSDDPNQGPTRVVADLKDGHVLSSLIKAEKPDEIFGTVASGRHAVVLDIDYPAALIPSETAGHFHLYLDVPGGIDHKDYMGLLMQLGRLGVIEPGYANASFQRGHSDVRLPWITKAESGPNTFLTPSPGPVPQAAPKPVCCRCRKTPWELDEYRSAAAENLVSLDALTEEVVNDYVRDNEGTLDPRTGWFACTDCYIKLGQPTGPTGWRPSGPIETEPALASNIVNRMAPIPVEDLRF
jgi:hypothetical protein